MIETIVDRLVIRGDDPRHVDESGSWMKIRGLLVAIAPALVAVVLLGWADVPPTVGVGVPVALTLIGVKAVAYPINKRIDELDRADDTSGTGGTSED